MNLRTTQPDYDAIVTELIKSLVPESHKRAAICVRREEILREFRTIRFGGGRQTGKSTWAVEQIAKSPDDVVMFVKDDNLAKTLYNQWVDRHVKQRSTGLFPRYADESDELLSEKVSSRILRQHVLKDTGEIPTLLPLPDKAPKIIIFDEAAHYAHFFMNAMYGWIATTADPDPTIILID